MINLVQSIDFPVAEIPVIYIEDNDIIVIQQNCFASWPDPTTGAISDPIASTLEPLAFDMSYSSGALDFWSDSAEEDYTSEDGQPV